MKWNVCFRADGSAGSSSTTAERRTAMIRQAISCDICGAEKKETNHWFVATRQGGELRVAGWNSNGRMRAGAKHLCGQTCLHKLMDEFIAGIVANRAPLAPDMPERDEPVAATDASLTSNAAYAASIPEAAPANGAARTPQVVPAAVIAISPSRAATEPRPPTPPPVVEDPDYGSRRRRAEAWERERERCSSLATHRKTF
jgi:hypothetical protein